MKKYLWCEDVGPFFSIPLVFPCLIWNIPTFNENPDSRGSLWLYLWDHKSSCTLGLFPQRLFVIKKHEYQLSKSEVDLCTACRLGFLGLLHMEVFNQRLEQEYNASVIVTAPTVPYKAVLSSPKLIKVRATSCSYIFFSHVCAWLWSWLQWNVCPDFNILTGKRRRCRITGLSVVGGRGLILFSILSDVCLD